MPLGYLPLFAVALGAVICMPGSAEAQIVVNKAPFINPASLSVLAPGADPTPAKAPQVSATASARALPKSHKPVPHSTKHKQLAHHKSKRLK